MASVNKVILIGNLGRDPEVRYTPSGKPVANLSIATTERWTNKDGERQERTEWHRVVLWGRQAEVAGQYLKKGSSCYIEGRIVTRSWEDKDKNKRYTTEIEGTALQLMSGGGGGRNEQQSGPPDEYYDSYADATAGAQTSSATPDAQANDDLPF